MSCNFMDCLTFYEKTPIMFKKQSIVVAFILLIITSACAQTSKKMVFDGAAEDRNLSGFTAINVTNAFDVYISQGTEDAVAVAANDASVTKNIKTHISGGVLYISFEQKGWGSWKNNKLKAYITVKDLQKLTVSGACNVSFVDAITSNYLQINLKKRKSYTKPIKQKAQKYSVLLFLIQDLIT